MQYQPQPPAYPFGPTGQAQQQQQQQYHDYNSPNMYSDSGSARMQAPSPIRVWVQRPNGSPTNITLSADSIVDEIRDAVLRKYANSLGRTVDAPDVVVRLKRRSAPASYRELNPEEQLLKLLQYYYPGGQTIKEALLISLVGERGTPSSVPQPSPSATSAGQNFLANQAHTHAQQQQHLQSQNSIRSFESGDYFVPEPSSGQYSGQAQPYDGPAPLTSPNSGIQPGSGDQNRARPPHSNSYSQQAGPGQGDDLAALRPNPAETPCSGPGEPNPSGSPLDGSSSSPGTQWKADRPAFPRQQTPKSALSHEIPTPAVPRRPGMPASRSFPSPGTTAPPATAANQPNSPPEQTATNADNAAHTHLPVPGAEHSNSDSEDGPSSRSPYGRTMMWGKGPRQRLGYDDSVLHEIDYRNPLPMPAPAYKINYDPEEDAKQDPLPTNDIPPINVLLVEDNSINLRILAQFARNVKLRFHTATNGEEALEKWRGGGFHLVLLDIHLPGLSGNDVTREIRRLERLNGIGVFPHGGAGNEHSRAPSQSRAAADPAYAAASDSGLASSQERLKAPPLQQAWKETEVGPRFDPGLPIDARDRLDGMDKFKSPVIIVALTASSMASDRREALMAGCNDYLTKPVNFHSLERKIREWGFMQALIDFDGSRSWFEAQREEEEERKEQEDRVKRQKQMSLAEDAARVTATAALAAPQVGGGGALLPTAVGPAPVRGMVTQGRNGAVAAMPSVSIEDSLNGEPIAIQINDEDLSSITAGLHLYDQLPPPAPPEPAAAPAPEPAPEPTAAPAPAPAASQEPHPTPAEQPRFYDGGAEPSRELSAAVPEVNGQGDEGVQHAAASPPAPATDDNDGDDDGDASPAPPEWYTFPGGQGEAEYASFPYSPVVPSNGGNSNNIQLNPGHHQHSHSTPSPAHRHPSPLVQQQQQQASSLSGSSTPLLGGAARPDLPSSPAEPALPSQASGTGPPSPTSEPKEEAGITTTAIHATAGTTDRPPSSSSASGQGRRNKDRDRFRLSSLPPRETRSSGTLSGYNNYTPSRYHHHHHHHHHHNHNHNHNQNYNNQSQNQNNHRQHVGQLLSHQHQHQHQNSRPGFAPPAPPLPPLPGAPALLARPPPGSGKLALAEASTASLNSRMMTALAGTAAAPAVPVLPGREPRAIVRNARSMPHSSENSPHRDYYYLGKYYGGSGVRGLGGVSAGVGAGVGVGVGPRPLGGGRPDGREQSETRPATGGADASDSCT